MTGSGKDDKASAEQTGAGPAPDQPAQATAAEAAEAAAVAEPAAVAEDEDEEMRRRYREALDRKQAHDTAGSTTRNGPGKAGGGAGSAHTARMFRRKAGG